MTWIKDHSHTHASNSVGTYKTEPARPPGPFTTRLPPGALPPSSRPSPGLSHNGLDDESYGLGGGDVDDDQLEDMFRGVLSDESDQHRGDQYFSSPHHPRSRILLLPPHSSCARPLFPLSSLLIYKCTITSAHKHMCTSILWEVHQLIDLDWQHLQIRRRILPYPIFSTYILFSK